MSNREHQIAYVFERNPQAAVGLSDAIDRAVDRLAEFPAMGRPGRVRETRELVITGTPLVLIYRIEDSSVLVLRLLHSAQRWPPRQPRSRR